MNPRKGQRNKGFALIFEPFEHKIHLRDAATIMKCFLFDKFFGKLFIILKNTVKKEVRK